MAAHKSIFDPQNNDDAPIRGGLDRFLGPPARAYSHMPGDLVDGEVDEEMAAEQEGRDPEAGLGPDRNLSTNPEEPTQQIKEALDEKLATDPKSQRNDTEVPPAD